MPNYETPPAAGEIRIVTSFFKNDLVIVSNLRGLANEFPLEIDGTQYEKGMIMFKGFIGQGGPKQIWSGVLVFIKLREPSEMVGGLSSLLERD